jgi:hypothetical protein
LQRLTNDPRQAAIRFFRKPLKGLSILAIQRDRQAIGRIGRYLPGRHRALPGMTVNHEESCVNMMLLTRKYLLTEAPVSSCAQIFQH